MSSKGEEEEEEEWTMDSGYWGWLVTCIFIYLYSLIGFSSRLRAKHLSRPSIKASFTYIFLALPWALPIYGRLIRRRPSRPITFVPLFAKGLSQTNDSNLRCSQTHKCLSFHFREAGHGRTWQCRAAGLSIDHN